MNLRLERRPARPAAADVCLAFVRAGQRATAALPSAGAAVDRLLRDWAFRGRLGELALLPAPAGLGARHLLLAGLGDDRRPAGAALKEAAAAAARRLRGTNLRSAVIHLPDAPEPARLLPALLLGFRRGWYSFSTYRRAASPPDFRLRLAAADRALEAGAQRLLTVAAEWDAVCDLANAGGNASTPSAIAAFARQLARRLGLRYTLWDARRLAREGCRAHVAVGQGSAEPPCLIRLDYRPARPRGRLVTLVGKTLTFDSGGLSIKPAKSMESMKFDKCGGMAVLAVLAAAAQLGLRRPLTGFLAAAENMTGSRAQRPGDIVRTRKGLTVEVLNTDAEGRLVLADALDVAAETKPEVLVDLATLTGAAITALGREHSALLGQGDAVLGELQAAGQRCGERLWRLPLDPAYRGLLASPVADLRNIGDGTAGTIVGGMFLQQFVPAEQTWAHIDLTHAWDERDGASAAAGATLFGAHLLTDWLQEREHP